MASTFGSVSEARRWCDYSEDEEDGEDLGALWLRDGFTRAQVDSVSLTASSSCMFGV